MTVVSPSTLSRLVHATCAVPGGLCHMDLTRPLDTVEETEVGTLIRTLSYPIHRTTGTGFRLRNHMLRSLSGAARQRASHTTLYTGNGALGAEVTSVTGFPRPRYPLPRGPTSVWPVATSPWRDWVICAPAVFLSRGFHPLGVSPVATLGRAVQPPLPGPARHSQ